MRNKLIAFILALGAAVAPATAQTYTSQTTTLKNNLKVTGSLTVGVPQTLTNVENAITSKFISIDIGANAALANSTTYISNSGFGRAGKIINIVLSASTAPAGGTNTVTITKNGVTTLLSTANVDPTTLTNATGKILTLTGTPANLQFAPTDTVTVTWASGVQTTAAVGPSVTVEYVPTADY